MLAQFTRPLALVATLAALPALAQETAPAADPAAETGAETGPETAAEAPAADAQPGDAGPAVGAVYVAETQGDWQLRCVRTETGDDPCQMYQLLTNAEGGTMAEITLFNLPEAGEAVAGATIVTPLETLLNQNLTIQVKNGEAKRYPFTFCFANPVRGADGAALLNDNGVPELDSGCVARVGFTAAEVDAFRKGSEAAVTVYAVGAPNQPFTAIMSLTGFTASYTAMEAANAKADAAAAAAGGQ